MNIDKEIAIQVMEYVNGPVVGWYRPTYHSDILIKDWHPSSNIRQAINDVLAKFDEWSIVKGKFFIFGKEYKYCCWIIHNDWQHHGYGNTPSEAICKAALAAVEGE